MHLDSTPLPIAESMVRFAVDDQCQPDAGDLDYFQDFTISDSDAINPGSPGPINPSNRGVKCLDYGKVDNVTINSAVAWRSPLGAAEFHDANCDWLTLTATDDRGIRQLFDLMVPLADARRSAGDDTAQGKELQYQGHRVGRHVFYGESDRQGAYLRVSGSVAPAALLRVREMQQRHFHATRYDAQVTACYAEIPDREFFRGLAITSQEYGAAAGRRGRPWSCEVRETLGRGDTAYICDKATAEVYGRCYDKHKEGAKMGIDYAPGSVRFEVSHRREMANMLLADMVKCDDVAEYTLGYVSGWFGLRGVEVATVKPERQVKLPVARSDAEKRRRWFRSQVRKGAQINADAIGLEETLKDLGLWEKVCNQLLDDR